MEKQLIDAETQKTIIFKYMKKIRQVMNSNVPNVPEHKQHECRLEIVESIVSTLFKEVTDLIAMEDPLKASIASKVKGLINLNSEKVSNEEAVLFKVALLLEKGFATKVEEMLQEEFPVLETTESK